jgi:hypothetical protein
MPIRSGRLRTGTLPHGGGFILDEGGLSMVSNRGASPALASPSRKLALLFRRFLGLATLVTGLGLSGHAQADPESPELPPTYTAPACRSLVLDTGRMIAWARWEKRYPLEKVRFDPYQDGTPSWVIQLVERWVVDAYEWKATDEQVLQWASELGNTQSLPRANQLTAHETIAIWMRRIARQCGNDSTARRD